MFKKNISYVFVLMPIMSNSVLAEEDLGNVVISSSRLPESQVNLTSQIEIVTEKDISNSGADTLTEVLELLPSIQIKSNGGRGQSSSVYVRGGSAEQVLFLLDGNPIKGDIACFNTNLVPTNMIEKVEYIRGTKATVYGANAIFGVVNIITKPKYKNKSRIGINFDSKHSAEIGGNAVIANDNNFIKVAIGGAYSRGYNVHPSEYNKNQDPNHGYNASNVQVMFGHTFESDIEIYGGYDYLKLKGKYDNSYLDWYSGLGHFETDVNDVEKNIYTIGSNLYTDTYSYDTSVMYTRTYDYNYPKGEKNYSSSTSLFDTDAISLHFINDYKFVPSFKLGAGVEYDYNLLDKRSNSSGSSFSSRNLKIINRAANIFAKYDDGLLLSEVGYRYDDNSIYGSKSTYNLGVGVNITENHLLRINGGTAFRAPTLQDLYFPFMSNPKLEPEKSRSIEMSYNGSFADFGYSFTFYQNKLDDMIAFDQRTWLPYNIQSAKIRGFEIGANYKYQKSEKEYLDFKGMIDLINPKDDETGKTLPYRSKQMYKAIFTGQKDLVKIYADYKFYSKRYTNASNTDQLGGYGLFDLGAGLSLVNNKVSLMLKIDNVLDKDNYELVKDYAVPGRVVSLNIEFTDLFLGE